MQTGLVIPCYFLDQSFIDITQKCLDSLKYGQPDYVVVVDDGSPLKSKLSTVRRKQNGGFAKAVNTGLKRIIKLPIDVIVVSNNDIVFTPGWLDHLLKPLREGYDISSIRTSDCDGYTTEDKTTEGDKFGSLWAMKREVYETIGGLDERFGRGTFEDTDYRRRAIAAGFKIAKNHRAVVEHTGRATFDVVDPERRNFGENRRLYQKKWGTID